MAFAEELPDRAIHLIMAPEMVQRSQRSGKVREASSSKRGDAYFDFPLMGLERDHI